MQPDRAGKRDLPGNRPARNPLWVSAQALQADDGVSVRWDLLPQTYQKRYQTEKRRRLAAIASAWELGDAHQAETVSRCPEAPTKYFRSGHGRANRNLRELVAHAIGVYRGKVRDRASGFANGRLATLLELEVELTLKAEADHSEISRLLVEYPYADVELPGDHLFCLRPDRSPAV